MIEEDVCQLSDNSGDDDILNPFDTDPVFQTKEDLEEFKATCDLKAADSDHEEVEYDYSVKKVCLENTCGKWKDICSKDYEHMCCQQFSNWKVLCGESEMSKCITETDAFTQATNHFALRTMIIQRNRKKRIRIPDPPTNNMMRYAYYLACYLHIDGVSKKRRPLPSCCVMALARQLYPSNDGTYTGFIIVLLFPGNPQK